MTAWSDDPGPISSGFPAPVHGWRCLLIREHHADASLKLPAPKNRCSTTAMTTAGGADQRVEDVPHIEVLIDERDIA